MRRTTTERCVVLGKVDDGGSFRSLTSTSLSSSMTGRRCSNLNIPMLALWRSRYNVNALISISFLIVEVLCLLHLSKGYQYHCSIRALMAAIGSNDGSNTQENEGVSPLAVTVNVDEKEEGSIEPTNTVQRHHKDQHHYVSLCRKEWWHWRTKVIHYLYASDGGALRFRAKCIGVHRTLPLTRVITSVLDGIHQLPLVLSFIRSILLRLMTRIDYSSM